MDFVFSILFICIHLQVQKKEPRWQDFEVRALVSFCADNQAGLHGSGGGAGVESTKRKLWTIASEVVRAAGGSERDWKTARKKWSDLSYRAKQYKNKREGKGVTGR